MDAIRYATLQNCIQLIVPSRILDDALRTGNKTLFLNVYRWLEESGLLPIGASDPHKRVDTEVNRFISIYREIWGEVVDMEALYITE